jgi:ankyrin repeat protein
MKSSIARHIPNYLKETKEEIAAFKDLIDNLPKPLQIEKNAHIVALKYSISLATRKGYTALHYAIFHNRADLVTPFISLGADVNAANREGFTLLHFAIINKATNNIALALNTTAALIKAGANVKAQTDSGISALHLAIYIRFTDVVPLLIGNKADVNAQTKEGFTPLHFASSARIVPVVQLLIGNRANVNTASNDGLTPLHLAIKAKITDLDLAINIVSTLIKAGADLNAQTKEGFTPLHFATIHEVFRLSDILIKAGANSAIKDNYGLTAWEYANEKKHNRTPAILQPHACSHNELYKASINYMVHPTSQDASISYTSTSTSKKQRNK